MSIISHAGGSIARNVQRLAAIIAASLFMSPAHAASHSVLYEYGASWADSPTALVEGSDGNFYGTGVLNGTPSVYRLTPAGSVSILRNFPAEFLSPLAKGSGGALWFTSRNHIYKMSTTGALRQRTQEL